MNFLLYIPSLLIFIVTVTIMYLISEDTNKNDPGTIFIRNIIPASIISALVFIIIKYKDAAAFNHEPMMNGNYFD